MEVTTQFPVLLTLMRRPRVTVVAIDDRVANRIVSQSRQLGIARIRPVMVVALDLLLPSIGIADHDASAVRFLVYFEVEVR